MAQKSELQRRVVQEHKINIKHCLLFLEVIGNFCVPSEFQKIDQLLLFKRNMPGNSTLLWL